MSALVKHENSSLGWQDMRQQADVLVKSGFLPAAIKTAEQAMAIMLMGEALDLHPMIALQSINVIAGKPAVSPQLMLALCRRTGQLESLECLDENDTAIVRIKRRGEPVHETRFSMEDARLMKTTEYVNNQKTTISLSEKANWKQQPKVMRQWRAIAANCRVTFPDAIWGIASYTPDEMGADVTYTESGEIIDIKVTEPQPTPPPAKPADKPAEQPTTTQDVPWYDDPAKMSVLEAYSLNTFKKSLADSAAKIGKWWGDFATGKDAAQAIKDAWSAPATTKSNGTPWTQQSDEINAFRKMLGGFEQTMTVGLLKQLGKAAWTDFASRAEAEEAVRRLAFAEQWSVVATQAEYLAWQDKKAIQFITVAGRLTWWKGRHELVAAVSETAGAGSDWSVVAAWEFGTHELPEMVRLGVRRKDDHLEIDSVHSAVGIPF